MTEQTKYQPSKLAYEIYKTEREKIVKKMERGGYSILDVGEQMTKDDFDMQFNIAQGEMQLNGEKYNPRSIATFLAKKQTYYVHPNQVDAIVSAYERAYDEKIEKHEVLLGSKSIRDFFLALDEEYHEIKGDALSSGMNEKEATKYAKNHISYTYFGSEAL